MAADAAGGWGKYTVDASGLVYYCAGRVYVGDNVNTLTWDDTGKTVIFTYAGSSLIPFRIYNHATVNWGTLLDATTKRGSNGLTIIWAGTGNAYLPGSNGNGAVMNCYACTFINKNAAGSNRMYINPSGNFYDCLLSYNAILQDVDASSPNDVYRCSIMGSTIAPAAFYPVAAASTINDLLISGCQGAINWYNVGSSTIINNLKVNGASSSTFIFAGGQGVSHYLVNPIVESWSFDFGGYANAKVYRQYEFDLQTDTSATVTLTNAAGATVFSVTSDAVTGAIATQTVSRGYYQQATGDTLQDYGSFTLTVSKAGKLTYTHSGIVLDEKIDWRITLRDQLSGNANPSDVLNGRTFYKDNADQQLTGELMNISQGRTRTRTVIKHIEDPADEALLMATAVLIIKNRHLKRKMKQLEINKP